MQLKIKNANGWQSQITKNRDREKERKRGREREREIDAYMVEKMSSSRNFSYNRDSNNISSLDIFLSIYSRFRIDTRRIKIKKNKNLNRTHAKQNKRR